MRHGRRWHSYRYSRRIGADGTIYVTSWGSFPADANSIYALIEASRAQAGKYTVALLTAMPLVVGDNWLDVAISANGIPLNGAVLLIHAVQFDNSRQLEAVAKPYVVSVQYEAKITLPTPGEWKLSMTVHEKPVFTSLGDGQASFDVAAIMINSSPSVAAAGLSLTSKREKKSFGWLWGVVGIVLCCTLLGCVYLRRRITNFADANVS